MGEWERSGGKRKEEGEEGRRKEIGEWKEGRGRRMHKRTGKEEGEKVGRVVERALIPTSAKPPAIMLAAR